MGRRNGRWTRCSRGAAMLEVLSQRYGRIEPVIEVSLAPADRFILPDGTGSLRMERSIASSSERFARADSSMAMLGAEEEIM